MDEPVDRRTFSQIAELNGKFPSTRVFSSDRPTWISLEQVRKSQQIT